MLTDQQRRRLGAGDFGCVVIIGHDRRFQDIHAVNPISDLYDKIQGRFFWGASHELFSARHTMVVSLRMKWRDPKFIIPALAVLSGVAMLAMIAGWIALLMFAPD